MSEAKSKEEKRTVKVVEDFTDEVEQTTGFVRENYIKSFKLPISLWEENLKFLNTQIEQWLSFQQDYINSVTEFYGKVSGWNGNLKNPDNYFKYPLALQKSYTGMDGQSKLLDVLSLTTILSVVATVIFIGIHLR
jgi:hypothetical protein